VEEERKREKEGFEEKHARGLERRLACYQLVREGGRAVERWKGRKDGEMVGLDNRTEQER